MSVSGLSHLTFVVRDLERSALLWVEGLGAQQVYDSGEFFHSHSPEKFFLLGGVWIALMQGEPGTRSYRHAAFEVAEAELPAFEARLRALGAEVQPPRPRIQGEGVSLYFHDYDDNLLELHSGTLEQRLATYAMRRSAASGA
ncbi:VOC family protein [Aquimonas sp.]|jgi:catechol 2,3-dioxygenase-like lactoylglutathione lyase family enzyme|uniref:VOC family protein n=1 Tax=Aquimonas sp. TaxID=1872588 RepID=UPI0037BEE1A1